MYNLDPTYRMGHEDRVRKRKYPLENNRGMEDAYPGISEQLHLTQDINGVSPCNQIPLTCRPLKTT
jgi:hypothetical protein